MIDRCHLFQPPRFSLWMTHSSRLPPLPTYEIHTCLVEARQLPRAYALPLLLKLPCSGFTDG